MAIQLQSPIREGCSVDHVTVATLKLFGGHPALDFTNTVNSRGSRYDPDVLRSYGDLLDWSLRLKVLNTPEAELLRGLPADQGKSALRRAKNLREGLYRIFSSGLSADPDDLHLLQREVLAAHQARTLEADSKRFGWRWRIKDPDTITHRISLAAADLLLSPSFSRVRVCPGENCAWLFVDNSRSGRRIWCSEETCGTRNRVRRWRARHLSG
jgi:predicted RNA-binding Zn ribbon-like protein